MFDPTTLVGFHTWLSLIAVATGVVVMIDLIRGPARPAWTAVFLLTALATSATGFVLPFERVLPSHIVGGIALVVLAVALLAQYRFRLAGAWGWRGGGHRQRLSPRLRGRGAGLCENTGPACARPDPIGSPIRSGATRRAGLVRRARCRGRAGDPAHHRAASIRLEP